MTWADQAVAAIEPWYTLDWETWMRSIAGMFAEVELFAEDVLDDDGNMTYAGWSIMLDPDRCPAKGLPYLAQWVGERLPVGVSEDAARQWIKDAPNQWRGTPYSVARAAQRWLTGGRLVQIRERSYLNGTSDPDAIAVQTFAAETPNIALVKAELRKVIPADIVLDFQTTVGSTWGDVKAGYATWAAVSAQFATWADVAAWLPTSSPGYVTWR